MSDDSIPSISIVTPAYNAEKLIGRTIQSVIDQTFTDWEMIVVDDCSQDATRQVVEKWVDQDSRIRLESLSKNFGGPAGPRNVGVKLACGKYIAFLDSDDIWHPQKLEIQLKILNETGRVFCSSEMEDFKDESDIKFSDPIRPRYEEVTFARQLRRYRTPTSSVILKRELISSYPFNESLRYKAREDLDCWLRIHEHIGISIKVKYPLLKYRLIQGQISGAKWKMLKRTLMVLDEYRFKNGRGLGWKKYFYLGTHLAYSLYYRVIKKTL